MTKFDIEENPINLIHKKLWFMIDRNDNLKKWIREKNRITYTKANEVKQAISSTDTPELALFLSGYDGNIKSSSSSSSFNFTYTWRLIAGDLSLREIAFPLMWELLRSTVDWDREDTLCGLRWNGEKFVKSAAVSNQITSQDDDDERIAGFNTWISLLSIEVRCDFGTDALRLTDTISP